MNDLQIKMLEMMSWYHELCEKNNLRYYVVGGTALGAIRHKGFIPWDDDIDVGMPRADYEKFQELVRTADIGTRYKVEFPSEKKDFVYPYGKVYDTSTTLIEHTRYKTKRGIFIDVFPLDGLGNDKDEAISNFEAIDRKYNLLATEVCALRKERGWYKNLAIIIARCIPPFILSARKLIRQIEELSKKNSFDESVYAANAVGNWHKKEIMRREWFGKPTLYDFETIKVYGPENYHEYLTQLYGDYMKLPPKEKQVSHHDYMYFNTEKSYLED